MFHFDGSYRRAPQQSLGGRHSGEDKKQLLIRVQEERKKREEIKLQQKNATKIQSFYRGCRVREREHIAVRNMFDSLVNQKNASPPLLLLVRYLNFFYHPNVDDRRLLTICHMIITNHFPNFYRMQDRFTSSKFVSLCLRCLNQSNLTEININPIVRFFELHCEAYPSIDAYFINILLANDYYHCMYRLLLHKVPPSLELNANPPTPLAATILNFLMHPIASSPSESIADVMKYFVHEFCCHTSLPQVQNFLLPAFISMKSSLPYDNLIHAMEDELVNINKENSSFILYSVLKFTQNNIAYTTAGTTTQSLLRILHHLFTLSAPNQRWEYLDDDDEEETEENLPTLVGESLKVLECPQIVGAILSSGGNSPEMLAPLCALCGVLMSDYKLSVHKTRMLYTLAIRPNFLKTLWKTCIEETVPVLSGSHVSLLFLLARGADISIEDLNRICPLFSIFCALFSYLLVVLYDSEFFSEVPGDMPFSVWEVKCVSAELRNVCLGLISLAHPSTKPNREQFRAALASVGLKKHDVDSAELQLRAKTYASMFKLLVVLVRQLYSRDCRRRFCPEGHWISQQVQIVADKPSQIFRSKYPVFTKQPFGYYSILNSNRDAEEGPPLSVNEVRDLTILLEVPFVIPFEERVKIFHKFVERDRRDSRDDMASFSFGEAIRIEVRRSHLYEDAFEKLSVENEPNMKLKMQVRLKNFTGLDEAGIDGGGLFREFLSELLLTGFDPNRGFFKHTNDQLLYPNPASCEVVENPHQHYFFLGRMLGKAVYENMLVELPFASFFLSKILSRHGGDVDIHQLKSLDPEMYKNLSYLKTYSGDVTEIGLDFTVVNNNFGKAEIVELLPGGRDMVVDRHNLTQYIHLMADYRLNKQIRSYCNALRQGLADVLNLEWLRMFDPRELQTLISGASTPINVEDMKAFTNYSGGYTVDHPVIANFWQVVGNMDDVLRGKLLKFVTSCSRPPLLGFKELHPAFCIHYAGNEPDRLPTASTCMNLLKLPEFKSKEMLQDKLMYAIESETGFELS